MWFIRVVKKLFTYSLLAFFGFCHASYSQKFSLPEDPVSFGGAVEQMLTATNNEHSTSVGTAFNLVWNDLGIDHKKKIIAQCQTLTKKKFKPRPHFTRYFDAIVRGRNVEAIDNKKLTDYLNMTGKVIDNYDNKKIIQYLAAVITFFEHRALFHERSNKLFVANDDYTFEYAGIEEVDEDLPIVEESEEAYFEEWDGETEEDWGTDWEEESTDKMEEDFVDVLTGGPPPPVVTGPCIKFNRLTLNFATAYDSVFLYNTSGSYDILAKSFVGEGGKFDWTSAGLGADSVYCVLSAYNFDVTKPRIAAEQAKLTYDGRLNEPVEGIFEFKSVRHDSTANARFPRFKSYKSDIEVNNIGGQNLLYHGGFSLEGNKINSSSVLGNLSTIELMGEESRKFKARSKLFVLGDSIIRSNKTSIVVYHKNDSIYHPAVRLSFNTRSEYLILQKDKGGFRNTPYTSSFFDVDFTSDIIRWDTKSDSLEISILGARNLVPAYFESTDHYNLEDYRYLGDKLYDFNPLGLVVLYGRKQGSDEFYSDDLARRYKKDPRTMRGAMKHLMQKGLIEYNVKTGRVKLKEKAKHMVASREGKKDYDNILIRSVTDRESNAILNFQEEYMTIRGVEYFKVSDSLQVFIVPDSSEITLLKGRDLRFNGTVSSGNFEYIGHDFTFRYDSFQISLNQIDSIRFYVQEQNTKGDLQRRQVDNTLQGSFAEDLGQLEATSGTLYINVPDNKSGRLNYPGYPKFNTTSGAVMYFDRNEVLNGAYDKSVYFMVPPFNLDSLDESNPSDIGFDGVLVTNSMFPEFEERLHIMEDYSFGFEHQIPNEGYQLYGGEGKIYNRLQLDKRGIRGDGFIDFLSSTLESNDFIFYPDSVTAMGTRAEIRNEEYGGIVFPSAYVDNYSMKWLPKKDSMYISNHDSPIHFYEETADLDGTAILTTSGVFGKGVLATRGSESISEQITFESHRFSARHAKFEIKSDDPEKPALAGEDVRLRFNLEENYADISPEIEGVAAVTFPYAQFKTSIPDARWDLQEQKITMTKPEDVPLESSYFYTMREELDSLSFNATEAVYNINTLELKVSGIPFITVADAKITPENNEVLILENSRIGRLSNTVIVLDTLNEYHRLIKGEIDIYSRNEFSGYATYQFVNALGDTVNVQMENFRLESFGDEHNKKEKPTQHTVANGSIMADDDVLISPGMFYKGDVTLIANQPALELDGYVKLNLTKIEGYDTWIKYSSNADQVEVAIDFDNSITEEGRVLEAGLFFSGLDNSLYSTFISDKDGMDDEPFFRPSGSLFYDSAHNEYIIEDPAKTLGNSFSGKVFAYNEHTSDIRFEGPVKFADNIKGAAISASVLGTGNLASNAFTLNTFMVLDFAIGEQAYQSMALDIEDVINNLGAPEGLGDPTQLLYKVSEIIGEKATKQYEKESLAQHVSLGTFARQTSKPMVFADINFKWSSEYNAFYSEGKLGMSNILTNDINGAFDGFFEIRKNEDGGSVLNLFLKASPDSWYYFGLEDNRLLTYSSNEAFNDIIYKKTNAAKAKLGELVFVPGDESEVLSFINRFRLNYYGIDDLYELGSEVEEEVEEEPDDGFGGTEEEDESFEEEEDDGF